MLIKNQPSLSSCNISYPCQHDVTSPQEQMYSNHNDLAWATRERDFYANSNVSTNIFGYHLIERGLGNPCGSKHEKIKYTKIINFCKKFICRQIKHPLQAVSPSRNHQKRI